METQGYTGVQAIQNTANSVFGPGLSIAGAWDPASTPAIKVRNAIQSRRTPRRIKMPFQNG